MKYDCVLVLGGNIARTPQGDYIPSTYEHSDEYGMLGGHMRIIAAVWMYVAEWSDTFVFSTGTSEKTKAALGHNVPTEAYVYSQEFIKLLAGISKAEPTLHKSSKPVVILENHSQNTVGNIQECFALIKKHSWKNVAFISADLHIPRVQALAQQIRKTIPIEANVDFLGAETVVKQLRPGEYDKFIDAAHNSPEGRKRARNEAQGLADLQRGHYVMSEFQLHGRSKDK